MIKMTQPKLYTRGTKLWIRFSLNGEVIKKSLNIENSKVNKKLALTQIIPQMILKVHSGEFFNTTIVPTLKEMISISLNIHKGSRKFLTTKAYESVFRNNILPYFGNRKLDFIKPSELLLWQNDLLESNAPKSVAKIRTIFYGVFEDAIRDELINRNPFMAVRTPKISVKRKINTFSKDEIFKIISKMPINIRAYFAIGFFTGMRTGEITALKWEDIDLENKTIKVQRTRNKGIESTPKTISSIREIDILDVLLPYLQEHEDLYSHQGYIFQTRNNVPFHTASQIARTYWKPVLKELKLEYRNLYQMRHTFASMMISSGEDILWVSNMLGHKNSAITLQVYAKYTKDDTKVRGTFLLE